MVRNAIEEIRALGLTTLLSLMLAQTAASSMLDWVTSGSEQEVFEITGAVVCTTCQPDEVRELHPDATALYPVTHSQGQFVFKVEDVSGLSLRRAISWPDTVELQLADEMFLALAAEKNRFKKVKLDARLNRGRIVEILNIHVP